MVLLSGEKRYGEIIVAVIPVGPKIFASDFYSSPRPPIEAERVLRRNAQPPFFLFSDCFACETIRTALNKKTGKPSGRPSLKIAQTCAKEILPEGEAALKECKDLLAILSKSIQTAKRNLDNN